MVTVKRYFKGIRKPGCAKNLWNFLLAVIIVGVLLLVVRGFFYTQVSVAAGTLHPTLIGGDRVLVNRTAYGIRLPFMYRVPQQHIAPKAPQKGEWCIIEVPEQSGVFVLEKITALPGDVVKIQGEETSTKRLEVGTYATENHIIQHRHLIGRPICVTYSIDDKKEFAHRLRTDRFFLLVP